MHKPKFTLENVTHKILLKFLDTNWSLNPDQMTRPSVN